MSEVILGFSPLDLTYQAQSECVILMKKHQKDTAVWFWIFQTLPSGKVLGDNECFPLPGTQAGLVPLLLLLFPQRWALLDTASGVTAQVLSDIKKIKSVPYSLVSWMTAMPLSQIRGWIFFNWIFSDYHVSLALNCIAHAEDPLISRKFNYHPLCKTFTPALWL